MVRFWKKYKMSHCNFLQYFKRYCGCLTWSKLQMFPKICIKVPHTIKIRLRKNFSPPGNQFWARFFKVFHVTLLNWLPLKTVQNHLFSHNFLICKPISSLRHAKVPQWNGLLLTCKKTLILLNWARNTRKTVCYSVTAPIWKCPKHLGKSK